MFCNLKITHPYFSVILKDRKEEKRFVFAGPEHKNQILKKIENKQNITISDKKKFIETFGKKYDWLTYKGEIKFIKNFINVDDTIQNLKTKIYVLLNKYEDIISPPVNQQLYLHTGQIIGNQFKNVSSITTNKFKIDKEFVDSDGFKKIKEVLNKTSNLIMDEIDIYDKSNYNIYCVNLSQIIERITNKKIKIDNFVINGYLRKYYPNMKMNIDPIFEKKRIDVFKTMIDKNEYIINLIKSSKCLEYCNCNITQTIFHTKTGISFNLVNIYNFLRRNLDKDLIYIKFRDYEWDSPFISLYKGSIKEKILTKDRLIKWTYKKKKFGDDIKIIIPIKGLMIRYFLYEINGERKYLIINFFENGTIDIKMSFLEEKHANINELRIGIHNFNIIIKKINKYLDLKIPESEIRIDSGKGRVFLKNVNFNFINVITNFQNKISFNSEDFLNFVKLFTPFVSPLVEEKPSNNSITFKYKRVTNFQNKPAIYSEISNLKNIGVTDNDILMTLEDKFNRTKTEADSLLKDWKKKYGYYGQQNVKLNSFGIDCVVNSSNLYIKGSNNIETITFVNKFVLTLIEIYSNLKKYKKDKKFMKYILSDKSIDDLFDYDDDIIDGIDDIDDMNDELDDEYGNIDDLGTVDDIEEYLYDFDADVDITASLTDPSTDPSTKSSTDSSTYSPTQYMKIPNENIQAEMKLSCDDKIEELGTCEDFCNDNSYFLRRLQQFDTKLFKFSSPDKKMYSKYSKSCQAPDYGQPVILQYDPKENTMVDQSSYTYRFQYGSNEDHQYWYICPRVWCPYDQIPINYNILTKFRKRETRKGKACIVAKCPFGDHDVIIRSNDYIYPGFITKKSHPDGYCLPCCFKKSQENPKYSAHKVFKRCLGLTNNSNADTTDIEYILNKSSIIDKNRFGLLNPSLGKLLKSRCESGYLKENTSCYVRKGIVINDNQSFLECIADLVSCDKSNIIDLKDLKIHLIESLTPILFKSLNKGLLELTFNVNDKFPLDNFKDFLLNPDTIIDETFMWDFLSRPGILNPTGTNIIILESYNIICPIAQDCNEFYNIENPTYIIVKMKQYYEPIYKLEKYTTQTEMICTFTNSYSIINELIDIIKNKCVNKTLDWDIILKENKKLYDIDYSSEYKKENTYLETVDALSNYEILKQVIDTYNRMYGVIIKINSKKVFVPVRPGAIDVDIDIIDEYDLLNFKDTCEFLKKIAKNTKLPVYPKYKLLSFDNNKYIIGLITSGGRILPVEKTIDSVKYNMPSRIHTLFLNIDSKIMTDSINDDDRAVIIKKMEFEDETFERIRYTFSKDYNNKYRKEISNLIKKDLESPIDTIFNDIQVLVSKFIKDITYIAYKPVNLKDYSKPNERLLCKYSIGQDPHCIEKNNKSKIIVNKINMITGQNNIDIIILKLTEEIVKNSFKRNELLKGLVPDIIDKGHIKALKNEIILTEKNIVGQVNDLFSVHKKYDIMKYGDFDYKQPSILIDKPYLLNVDISSLEQMSSHWVDKLGPLFNIHYKKYTESSLYEALAKIANMLAESSEYSPDDIKKKIIENIEIYDEELRKKYNKHSLIDVFKMIDYNLFKNAETLSDIEIIIRPKNYQGCLIDIEIFNKIFNIGSLVLDKRISKGNPSGFIMFKPVDKYFILYKERFKNTNIFNLIQKKEQVIFYNKII
tara:strand:+ start:10042 stop:15039 length:4998 start_codon:yes stop_codon:yes gene_type:complete